MDEESDAGSDESMQAALAWQQLSESEVSGGRTPEHQAWAGLEASDVESDGSAGGIVVDAPLPLAAPLAPERDEHGHGLNLMASVRGQVMSKEFVRQALGVVRRTVSWVVSQDAWQGRWPKLSGSVADPLVEGVPLEVEGGEDTAADALGELSEALRQIPRVGEATPVGWRGEDSAPLADALGGLAVAVEQTWHNSRARGSRWPS